MTVHLERNLARTIKGDGEAPARTVPDRYAFTSYRQVIVDGVICEESLRIAATIPIFASDRLKKFNRPT